MSQGKIKWFNDTKGFGFIEQDDGSDIFVHANSLLSEEKLPLLEGERVEFEIREGTKGPMANNVIRISVN